MLSIALQWRRARWLRHAPGKSGLLLLGVCPLIFMAPLQNVPLFSDYFNGAVTLVWLGTMTIAGVLCRDSGVVGPEDIWPFQKNIPLADWHLCNWLLNGSAAALILFWWACWFATGLNIYFGWDGQAFSAVILAAILVLLLAHSFLFFIGATGIPRGIDLFIIASILALLRDLLTKPLPAILRIPLRAIVPPVVEAYAAGSLLVQREASALKPLLAVLIYSFVCCTAAIVLLRRAKPPV